MNRLALLLVGVLAGTGVSCGGAREAEDPPQEVVTWSVDGDTIRCPNADDTTSFTYGGYQTFDCVWLCATYKGEPSSYVSLGFRWTGSTWVLESEYVSGGIC